MGLFGNMLAYHPGQFRAFSYFHMDPKINSGYTLDQADPPQTLRGVLQNSTSQVADSNGNLVSKVDENLWCERLLSRGSFVRFDDIVYRIMSGNDWPFEGGFYMYTLERMVGDNGTPDTGTYTTGIGGTPL